MRTSKEYVGDLPPKRGFYSQIYRYATEPAADEHCQRIRSHNYLIQDGGLTAKLEELRKENHVEIGDQRARIVRLQGRPAVIGQVELLIYPMSEEELDRRSV